MVSKNLYEKACNLGSPGGCYNLGQVYSNGEGVAQDYKKAERFYEKACEGGQYQGCYNLGYLYDGGLGVQQDYSKAKEFFGKACDAGHPKGYNQFQLNPDKVGHSNQNRIKYL